MFNSLVATVISDRIAEGDLPEDPTAVDLGNQTYGVPRSALTQIIRKLRGSDDAKRYRVDYPKLESFAAVDAEAAASYKVEEFYKALGFSLYEAVDVNSKHGSLMMDLNLDLAEHYGFRTQYDLVANAGTAEHVFNQAAVLRNAHNLARPGGYMIHILPFTGYFNHGFYNYQPGLFLDLADANSYELKSLRLAERSGILLDFGEPGEIIAHFRPFLNLMGRNRKNNTFLVAVMKKVSADEFKCPCQGKYVERIESPDIKARYARQQAGPLPAERSRWRNDGHGARSRFRRLKRKFKSRLLYFLRWVSRLVLVRL